MINQEELQISGKSYTNKDFQTIYPEILEMVKKLTNKWDPTATNESDPLVVILKLLGFVADKLNYNVDKNILEAFLPSATQESSFRNLLERDAYTMKYYQSATTTVVVEYKGKINDGNKGINLAPFVAQFSNAEDTIRYTVVPQPVTQITSSNVPYNFLVIEGSPADLTINGVDNIQLENLDDNNRIFFPIQLIAENGIYVKNVNSEDWLEWKQVNNLNTQQLLTPCFKFGFDSDKSLPYIEFPQDIASLIGNGLNIKYIKTSGYAGNIEAGKLINLSNPSTDNAEYFNGNPFADSLTGTALLRMSNKLSAINGADPETLNEAYNNFKKTTGTFDVLVTTRDFANYLYNYVPASSLSPLFSNIQVCDRRNDINYSVPYKVFNENGVTTEYTFKPIVYGGVNHLISPYDLVPYPLKTTGAILDDTTYDETFKPSTKVEFIPSAVDESQAICHTYVDVQQDSNNENIIYAILNEYALNAKISTVNKVNALEGVEIVNNVKKALYDNFNSRKIDYGYEIPYNSLLEVMENADSRIKLVNLDEPVITPKYLNANGNIDSENILRNQVIARNVLMGKVPLYEYDNNFKYDFGQSVPTFYEGIQSIKTTLTITEPANYKLKENQIVQLVKDKYVTDTTATVGVNFWWKSSSVLTANVEHTLTDNENLYLSWTDSNDVIQYRTYGEGTVIKPNFALGARQKGSTGYANIKVDSNKFPSPKPPIDVQPTDALFDSLQAKEEIAFVKKASVTLSKGSFDCYWFRNNADNELFPAYGDEESQELTLQDGEYFIYSDSTHSNLEILGSGTKLERVGLSGQLEKLNITASREAILSGDTTTINELNWQRVTFSSNATLTFTEQVFLTLTEGYTITCSGATLTTDVPTENKQLVYKEPESAESENTHTIGANEGWKIYAILALNAGPNKAQHLEIGESIVLTYGNAQTQTLPASPVIPCNLVLNEPLHIASTETIDLSMYKTEVGGTTIYWFNAATFNAYDGVYYTDNDGDNKLVQPNSQGFRIIAVEDVKKTDSVFSFNWNIPVSSNYTKFYVYWKSTLSSFDETHYLKIKQNGTTLYDLNPNLINECTFTTGAGNVITFNGLNLSDTDEIIISPLKIIRKDENTPKVNSDLGITMTEYTTALNALFDNNVPTWYSTLDVANDTAVNEMPMTGPYALFDKDNVANRMTIAKINFKDSKINIIKSSLL